MSNKSIFISHSSKDDGFVKELREALEGCALPVWIDSRNLRGGAKLAREIEEGIEQARQFIVVISVNTQNSPWVRKEIQKALEVEQNRKDDGYRVIPLLLPGVEPSALALWFDEEPVGVRVEIKTGGLGEALPDILAALGERLPTDRQLVQGAVSRSIEELILRLDDLKIQTKEGKRRAKAVAQLVYEPADKSARAIESRRFTFTAPLGVIEAEDLRWYLEEYFVWPIGVFKERAERIESQLPRWGQDLYKVALGQPVAQEALSTWQQAGNDGERRFSVFVDSELPGGASEKKQFVAREAATELLSLPWELLHDGRGFLFHGKHPVRVRRRLPNRRRQPVRPTRLPIRILMVSPRPEDNDTDYIDHRISAKPLVEAIESLGKLVELIMLAPPTFPALEEALQKAADEETPFDVVHFDGHGVYDHTVGLGGLCFEDPNEIEKLEKRAMKLVHAEKLAEIIRDHRIPLVFLEACQSAKTEKDPTASVAAKFLEEGVTSIVAMSHSILVETAHRYVRAFYEELAEGKRIGTAMLAGQRELYRDTYRGKMMGAGELHLQDWFVPVLYQEEQDPQLVTKLPPKDVQHLQAKQRHLRLGELPASPAHEFQGRSRELLALERLLHKDPYAVVRGQGGAGKSTLAIELARWLVRVGRFRRAAFVSLEQYTDARSVLDSLGRQLLPEGDSWSVANYPDLKQALQPVERALADRATIIVLDNMESVLPDQTGQMPPGAAPIEELFELCEKLLEADPATRIVFTSRETMTAPFDNKRREIVLGSLSQEDAIKLVGEVMKQEGLTPKSDDLGGEPEEIVELVEAVNRHARALVLLAREVSRRGVRATTENLQVLMADLHKKHPNDRENSLYASVELSLRRLPPDVREQIKVLSAFHGGAYTGVLSYILGEEMETVYGIARQLIDVGLAEGKQYGHLRLDPALPSYLLREMTEAEQEQAKLQWAEGVKKLTALLYEQRFEDIEFSSQLTLLELPNLMAMLEWIEDRSTPETIVAVAERVESLLSELGRPQAIAKTTQVRVKAARQLSGWSKARYLTERADAERLTESGQLELARAATQQLLQRCLAAGEQAYPDAAYDIGMAHIMNGRVLRKGGDAEAALAHLTEARRRCEALVDAGATIGERMASGIITESGDCLRDLGRYDEAATAYEEAMSRFEKLNDERWLAVSKYQLGIVRMLQGRYTEALEIFSEARVRFEVLREPTSVADAWHHIGILHSENGEFEEAERAFRQSLLISVQNRGVAGEALTLLALGNLYNTMERWEDAVNCYRPAAEIYVKLRDQNHEGMACNNLAMVLIKLQKYDEARRELHRAFECKRPYGFAATPWGTWQNLHDLEQALGNSKAAAQARQQAVESYLAYRRAGGQSIAGGAQLCDQAHEAIAQGDTIEIEQDIARLLEEDLSPSAKVLLTKLQAIVDGDRNLALADDPSLNYYDAVELQLLLESLGAK